MSGYFDNLFNGNNDDNLSPIVAGIGFGSGANKGFWEIQPRVLFGRDKGQWIEMGAEIRSALKVAGKLVGFTGRAVGSSGSPDRVRALVQGMSHLGIPDGMYELDTRHIELIGATLPDEYLRSKGIDPQASSDPFGSLLAQSDIPNIEDVQKAEITPDDLRLANGGVNTPEGQENAAFKNTPAGKAAIAQLPDEAAAEAKPFDIVDWGRTNPYPKIVSEPKYLEGLKNKNIAPDAEGDGVDLGELTKAIRKGIRSSFWSNNEDVNDHMDRYNDGLAKELTIKVAKKLGLGVAGSKNFLDYLAKNYDKDYFSGINVGKFSTDGLEEFDKLVDDYAANNIAPDAEGAPDSAAKVADKAIQDAFDGEDVSDVDSLLDDVLNDTPASDDISDLLGPEVDTSDFDRPVVEKASVDEAGIEVDDFVNNPENDDLLKITDFAPRDNGGTDFTGIDRDGVEQRFSTRAGDMLRRVIHGEPGDTSLQDYLATPTVAPVKPLKPFEFLPRPVTVPDNAIPAEDFSVGDKVWNADGNEIGTVRKVLEKGFDNFGRDYTKAEVVGPDGKVSTTKLGHERGYKKLPAPEKAIAPEKPTIPNEPAAIPEPTQVEFPTPDVAPASPPGPPNGPNPNGAPPPPEDLTPPTKKAESLVAGDKIYNANGTSGTVDSVSTENGKVTVNYTDQNGEAKSKRFLEGNDVNTKPTSNIAPDREANGNPISDIQKQTLEDLDAMDTADSIQDKALKQRLMDAYNAMQDEDFQDEGEIQDLIDEINDYYLAKNGGTPAATPTATPTAPAVRRGDHGRDIAPTEKSDAELFNTKVSRKDGAQDPDAILNQLSEDYPDGFFVDDPNDTFDGGFMTHRKTIDGGRTRLEVIVSRTIGNQFQTAFRFTDLKTGEQKTFISHDSRDSYSAIHGKKNGIEVMTRHFSGETSPVKVGSGEHSRYFAIGKTWQDRMKYWRGKFDKSARTEDSLNDKQRAELEEKYNGNIDAMNRAHTIEDMRMLTLEEKFELAANGEAETLNETTAVVLGNVERSAVESFYKAVAEGDTQSAKLRFQAMMNQLPDNSTSGGVFTKVIRQGLKDRLDASGVTGKQRTKALQQLSATVTNYILHANKQWSTDNEIKLPHVSGGGMLVVKEGAKVEFSDNRRTKEYPSGRKIIGRVVGLRPSSNGRGYNDFVRLQFLGEDGKLHTSDADLAATHMKLVDDNTPLTSYDGWDRLGDLTFSRLGQEATDKRKAARLKKGMSWKDPSDPNYNPNKVDLAYLGSDGVPQGEDPNTPSVNPSGVTKQAADLLSGDTIYDTNGNPLGTVVKTKITSKNGQPIVAVMYKDVDGNVQKIAYHPDQEIGPDAPKA